MDSLNYAPGSYKKHLSSAEIQRMKKAMKKVPVLQLQSDIYHNKEAQDAENILGSLDHQSEQKETLAPLEQINKSNQSWYHHYRKQLVHYFTSLFTA